MSDNDNEINKIWEIPWKRTGDTQVLVQKNIEVECGVTLPLLQFPLFSGCDFIRHGFTTRYGGVSTGEWSSLNLSDTRGDDPAAVLENFRRVSQAFDVSPEQIVCSRQTHTTNVRRITAENWRDPLPEDDGVDGLITDVPGILLGTFFADCVPLYFVDPVHRAIGLSHSGWRGTVHRMGAVTIRAMADAFGSDPADLLCAVGPSICQSCYEVSEDVAEQFLREFPEADERLLYATSDHKYQLNLWEANRRILLEAGVAPKHLSVTDICTCCNPTHLFSHRYTSGHRGNLGAFLMVRGEQYES